MIYGRAFKAQRLDHEDNVEEDLKTHLKTSLCAGAETLPSLGARVSSSKPTSTCPLHAPEANMEAGKHSSNITFLKKLAIFRCHAGLRESPTASFALQTMVSVADALKK